MKTYNDRGRATADSKDHAGAISDIDKAIEIDPQYVVAYRNRGISRATLNQRESGCDDLRKAIGLEDNYADVLF